MEILVCICTYKRNNSLIDCLKTFEKAIIPTSIKIKFLIVDNTINGGAKKTLKYFSKNFKFKIRYINEKRRGIVFARNKCLKELRNINCQFVAFFDDDGLIDKYWFVNFIKTINEKNYKILTGPQIHKKYNIGSIFEKRVNKDSSYVNWAATNNVIIEKQLIKSSNIFFDHNLNKFGMGEDQLFFLKLNKLGHKIYWEKSLKVYEKLHSHRKGIRWLIERSFRLGVLGNHIDKKIYGLLFGFLINYLKCFYYFGCSILAICSPLQKYYKYKILNYFFTSVGRMVGPIIFKKIKFYKQ